MAKTLHNSTADNAKKNVSDLIIWGNGDTSKLICKASSKKEGWMKSTKAMEIEGVGCVVQVTTQQKNETNTFAMEKDEAGDIILGQGDFPIFCKDKLAPDYSIAEAVTFVPGVKIYEELNEKKEVVSRKLVKI